MSSRKKIEVSRGSQFQYEPHIALAHSEPLTVAHDAEQQPELGRGGGVVVVLACVAARR